MDETKSPETPALPVHEREAALPEHRPDPALQRWRLVAAELEAAAAAAGASLQLCPAAAEAIAAALPEALANGWGLAAV